MSQARRENDDSIEGLDFILAVPGVRRFAASILVWKGRVARKKRNVNFDDSLRGIVNKALYGVNDQIKRMQSVVW